MNYSFGTFNFLKFILLVILYSRRLIVGIFGTLEIWKIIVDNFHK